MTTTTHYVRLSFAHRRINGLRSHAIREGASVSVCGDFERHELDGGKSASPPTCPDCKKALEGGP